MGLSPGQVIFRQIGRLSNGKSRRASIFVSLDYPTGRQILAPFLSREKICGSGMGTFKRDARTSATANFMYAFSNTEPFYLCSVLTERTLHVKYGDLDNPVRVFMIHS